MEDDLPDPVVRSIVVDTIVNSANPHAHAAFIGPRHRITSAQETNIVSAADSDFMQGVRIALGCASVLLAAAFVLGLRRFPRPTLTRAPTPTRANSPGQTSTKTTERGRIDRRPSTKFRPPPQAFWAESFRYSRTVSMIP